MYAVIKNGTKQYRVEEGWSINIERINIDVGDRIQFKQVMLIGNNAENSLKLGCPFVSGVKVDATIVEHGRAKKISITKFRRRKHSISRQGHRQYFTKVKIVSIKTESI